MAKVAETLGPLSSLGPHQIRQQIQLCRKGGVALDHRVALLNHLWQLKQYKDILDLLPPFNQGVLELNLRWHCQALVKMMTLPNPPLKRIIVAVFSYSSFLEIGQQKLLIDLVEPIIRDKNDPALIMYFERHLALLTEARTLSVLFLSPELLKNFDVDYRMKYLETLQQKKFSHPEYFELGGHGLLLAECGYFSEIDAIDLKDVNPLIQMKFAIQKAFGKPPLGQQILKPFYLSIVNSPNIQNYISDAISKFWKSALPTKVALNELTDHERLCANCRAKALAMRAMSKDNRKNALALFSILDDLIRLDQSQNIFSIELVLTYCTFAVALDSLNEKYTLYSDCEFLLELIGLPLVKSAFDSQQSYQMVCKKIQFQFVRYCADQLDLEKLLKFKLQIKPPAFKKLLSEVIEAHLRELSHRRMSPAHAIRLAHFWLRPALSSLISKTQLKKLNKLIVFNERAGF